METVSQSIIAMLAVINPFVCGSMILKLEQGTNKKSNIISGVKAMLFVLFILLISALAGKYVLNAFGISMDAFKVVGGIIISYIGFQMMSASQISDAKSKDQVGLSSLIMFAASPGSIAMAITLTAVHNDSGLPVSALAGISIAILLTILVIILMQLLAGKKKKNGQGLASKFMGLIVVAMGLQFILVGLKHFFGS
jgi:multiple antibiotic resistance protein